MPAVELEYTVGPIPFKSVLVNVCKKLDLPLLLSKEMDLVC